MIGESWREEGFMLGDCWGFEEEFDGFGGDFPMEVVIGVPVVEIV